MALSGPLPVAPAEGTAPPHRGPRRIDGTGRRQTPCLCHEGDTAGAQTHPQALGGGSRPGDRARPGGASSTPAGGGGAPSPAGSWRNYRLATDWEGQPGRGPRPTPYFPGGPRSLGHMTGPCQAQASGSQVGPGRPARRHGRKQAVCRPAALGLGDSAAPESHADATGHGRLSAQARSQQSRSPHPAPASQEEEEEPLAPRSPFQAHGTAGCSGRAASAGPDDPTSQAWGTPGVLGHRTPLKDSGVAGGLGQRA